MIFRYIAFEVPRNRSMGEKVQQATEQREQELGES